MTKKIDTLSKDIEQVLRNSINGTGNAIATENLIKLGTNIADKVQQALNKRTRGPRPDKTLYASEVGKPCHRQVWYDHNMPEAGEKLLPHNATKFLYGDILEELVLFLAKQAGHTVEREQERIEVDVGNGWKIVGRQDAIIDGAVVDVKSASPYSYDKIVNEGLNKDNDSFGYRAQLGVYTMAEVVKKKDKPHLQSGFLVIDKQNGKIGWGKGNYPSSMVSKIHTLVKDLENKDSPPARAFDAMPEGKSGNEKLCVNCSYCAYKRECWPGLRGFSYAGGRPVFLTKVVREPNVPELDLNSSDAANLD